MKKTIATAMVGLALLASWSCAPIKQEESPSFQSRNYVVQPLSSVEDYVLQPGDALEIKFYSYPELNEKLVIRPDGKISLQGIEEVKAAGMRPVELENLLTRKYAKRLRKPETTVIVKEFSAQKVFVGGEVKNPGPVPIIGKLTSVQAIFQAGGFLETAELRNVVILRNQGSDQPAFKTLNLKQGLESRAQQNDIMLKPYDVVFVPKSTIAKLDQFVNQYFERLLPISKNFGFSYVFGPILR